MSMQPTSLESFALIAPEIVLVAGALVAYLGGAFLGLRAGWLVALLGIAAAATVAGGQPTDGSAAASGGVVIDAFSTFVRWTTLALGALLALVQAGDVFQAAVSRGAGVHRGGTCEDAGTFLLMLAGLSLAGAAGDLVLLFVALELVSIPTYVLLALKRTDAAGQEAGLKYFFLSLVASALFLYAAACLYGIGGSTSLQAIAERLRSTDEATARTALVLLPAALGLVVVGAAFRLAAFPMHFYAPDVYQGAGPANAALLSTLPKVAGVVVLGRVLWLGLGPVTATAAGPAARAHLDLLWQLTAVVAAVTMTVGNVMALRQRNLRRLLACSSIAHAGYLLVGVAVAAAAAAGRLGPDAGPADPAAGGWAFAAGGMGATLFYLATYAPATIGVFAALAYLGHRWPEWTGAGGARPAREEIAHVDDLDGLSTTNPVAAFALALFLLSLAGIPPLPGFWGKLALLAGALEVDSGVALAWDTRRAAFVTLAVVLVVNAAIAAAYYLRIVAAAYFRSTRRGVQTDGGLAAGVAMLACVVLVLVVTARPQSLFLAASRAGDAVTGTLPVATAATP